MAKKDPYPKRTIKKVLRDISLYDVVYLEDLEKLRNQHISEFESFCIESIPNNCGCYHSCNCPQEKLAFKGFRPETDAEYQARLEKETAEQKARTQAQEEQERQMLAKLEAKYKKREDR
jgi:hypothetical protein